MSFNTIPVAALAAGPYVVWYRALQLYAWGRNCTNTIISHVYTSHPHHNRNEHDIRHTALGGCIISIAIQAAQLGIRAVLSDVLPSSALPWVDAPFQALTTVAGLHIGLARFAAKASLPNAVRVQALALGWAAAHTMTHMITPLLATFNTPTWPSGPIHAALAENVHFASTMAAVAVGGLIWLRKGRGGSGGSTRRLVALALLMLLVLLPLWQQVVNWSCRGYAMYNGLVPSLVYTLLVLLLSLASWLFVAPRMV